MDTSVERPEATSSATTFPPPPKSPHLDQPETTSPSPLPQAFIPSQGTSDLRRRAGKEKATIGKRRRLPRVAFELENRGSVARDHLASERTFLAWLRTSLALASIGIAITQLFRLPASTTGTPTSTTPTTDQIASISSALEPMISTFPQLSALQSILEAQQLEIARSVAKIENSTRYQHLGKPIGGTLIALALVFLFIGTHRYFSVQSALMADPSMFPPSRRSIAFSGFCVGALVIAAFAAVLATR